MTKRRPKIVLWRKRSTGRYCFKLCGSNGKPLVYSNHQYRTKDGAIVGINSVIDAASWLKANGLPLFEDQC
jgi:uncharacterized protein YegP (UPF0339 family)